MDRFLTCRDNHEKCLSHGFSMARGREGDLGLIYAITVLGCFIHSIVSHPLSTPVR